MKNMMKSNLCRCCLSSGSFKNLSNNYMCNGKLENYGEMISKTFDLTLNCLKMFICDDCITKLRDAATFKQQILEVQNTFNDFDFSCSKVWQPNLKESISYDIFDVKSESIEEPTMNEEISNASDIENEQTKIVTIENHKKLKAKRIQCKKVENVKTTKNLIKKTSPEKEAQKDQRENSIKLISNSNICLFKSLRTRFACYICNEKFFDIKSLKTHSRTHSDEDFKSRVRRLRGKSYENADISNLTCNLCTQTCTDLDNLRDHLIEQHNITFGDANHIFIPYKLEEGLRCEVCKDTFNTFTRLSIHMNIHATSNVCETCGISFFNRVSLRNHVRAVHKDHFCTQCSLKFPTTTKLVRHRQRIHNAALAKHYCLRCQLTFRYPYLLKGHMVEKHGDKYTTVECNTCRKVFKDSNCLKTHFRCVHLNERNFACSLCDLRFFTRTDRGRHEKTHIGGSQYACNLCETKFKSKDSIRRHMRRQHVNVSK